MPSSPEPPRPAPPTPRPTVVGSASDAVGFLDAPGVDASAVFDTVDDVFAAMPDGAILTVFSDDPTAAEAARQWCGRRDVELLAIIHHDHNGTTFTFRQRGQSPDDS